MYDAVGDNSFKELREDLGNLQLHCWKKQLTSDLTLEKQTIWNDINVKSKECVKTCKSLFANSSELNVDNGLYKNLSEDYLLNRNIPISHLRSQSGEELINFPFNIRKSQFQSESFFSRNSSECVIPCSVKVTDTVDCSAMNQKNSPFSLSSNFQNQFAHSLKANDFRVTHNTALESAMDDLSSDDEVGFTPLSALGKRHHKTSKSQFYTGCDEKLFSENQDERRFGNFFPVSCSSSSEVMETSEMKKNEMVGRNSGKETSLFNRCFGNSSSRENIPESSESSDDENNISPLAALASRYQRNDSQEISECEPAESYGQQELISASKSKKDDCFKHSAEILKLSCRNKCLVQKKELLVDEDSSSDDGGFSPLAALAGKHQKVTNNESNLELVSHVNTLKHSGSLCSSDSQIKPTFDSATLCIPGSSLSRLPSSTSDTAIHMNRVNKSIIEGVQQLSITRPQIDIQKERVRSQHSLDGESLSFLEDSVTKVLYVSEDCRQKMLMEKSPVPSFLDIPSYQLTRSTSCHITAEGSMNKKFLSLTDNTLSKSVPSRFEPTFLGSSEPSLKVEVSTVDSDQIDGPEDQDNSFDADDWIIDLTNAIRAPGLRMSCDDMEGKLTTQIIDTGSVETSEGSQIPCLLDASGILKMHFPYEKKKCSPFGKVLCRSWRKLKVPYIRPRRQSIGELAYFTFDTPSPDDEIFRCRRK